MQLNSHKKWRRRDIIILLERLEMYLSAGLNMSKVLIISEEGLSLRQKSALINLRLAVESGGTLSKGLRKYIKISETTAGLIEYGELSGALPRSLMTARYLLEKEDELYKKCTGAMAYPVVIGIFAGLLTIGLVRGVMPQIIPMLKSLKVELPMITKVVITLSEIITKDGSYILLVMIILMILVKICLKRIIPVRWFFHNFIIKIPIIGSLFYNYFLAVFLHSCGALVEAGLSVEEAYLKTIGTIPLLPLRNILEKRSYLIREGQTLGTIIVGKKIPSYITALLNAGEASGTLGTSIIKAGNILDRDIDHSLKKLTALIEPVMMAGMGCIVGAIALSIMMPIYSISSVLQK